MNAEIKIINGGKHTDERGNIVHCNQFDMSQVKRFYILDHPSTAASRAWHGHRREKKWFHVIRGTFSILLIKPDDWANPSPDLIPEEIVLKEEHPIVLHLSGGWATEIRATVPESRMIGYSDFSIEESANDSFRFDHNLWRKPAQLGQD